MGSQESDLNRDKQSGSETPPPGTEARMIHFDDLARGGNEVVIEFQNQHYRLRVTKNGKLILNK